ncbi:MAG: aspartate-semialdehyde dehydrogenase [Deltaproteobacteria bacterium]|nr:aspartate-semialdehyde dehydrogenase [Deltaproteobacteria bacterium]
MAKKKVNVAVVGATGAVGTEMFGVLQERGFPVDRLLPLASSRSAGEEIEFAGTTYKVEELKHDSFAGIDIALFSAGGKVSAEFAPSAAKAGAVVIDNTSHFRMDPDVPLVVPEVNAKDIGEYKKKRIIANPNCSTIQVVVAVKPLFDAVPVKRMVVSTYQAVSGAGKEAMDELNEQVTALYNHRELPQEIFGRQMAFNVLAAIGTFDDNGDTDEELKMRNESRKMLHLPALAVACTCVRVPVYNGHSVAVYLELEKELSPDKARALLREAPGVLLVDEPKKRQIPTPLDASGQDATLVGRVRRDESVPHGLSLFCCADNLRKGAATNAVQIAEILLRDHL